MKKLICSLFVLMLVTGAVSPLIAKADGNLDEIESYKITVDMESDGTMDLTYHIDWKVLDDSSEGPLTWVKIGIPNSYVDNIKALSSNISDIYYYSEGGDNVRIDLDKSYYAGEVVSFDFSIHQSHMYKLDRDNNLCSYSFTPGWFDDTDVKSMTILWNNENVLNSDATSTQGNYLEWTGSLSAGERLTATVSYRTGVFNTSDDMSSDAGGYTNSYTSDYGQNYGDNGYTSYNDSGNDVSGVIFPVIIFIIVFVISIVVRISGGGGRYRGGFGGYIGGFRGGSGGIGGGFGGGGHCACASSCACACACACAGGGRAGCSAKNFYGPAAQINKLECILRQDSKRNI